MVSPGRFPRGGLSVTFGEFNSRGGGVVGVVSQADFQEGGCR